MTTCNDRPGERLVRRLEKELSPAHLRIIDESHLHAGHPAARSGGGHFAVMIVSHRFEGLSRVARHRLVYRCLEGALGKSVHALALTTLTPSEWEESGSADSVPSTRF